jgi:lipopolysaccharide export system protein LptA
MLWAEDTENQDHTNMDEPIHIISDQLMIDNATGEAEFIGNVLATQKETVIKADRLKIFYDKKTIPDANTAAGEKSINKIIASGNVSIHFDNRLAEAQEAVYTAETKIIVLSGENSRITDENNMISGEKIIIHRDDGRIIVESGKNTGKVEAVINATGNGLN